VAVLLLLFVWPPAKAVSELGPSRIVTVNAATAVTSCDDPIKVRMIALRYG
jgi:hypothetical protein